MSTPGMIRAASSNIHSFGYDPAASQLYVRFGYRGKNPETGESELLPKKLYRYFDVPEREFTDLVTVNTAAISANENKQPVEKGVTAHFNERIKGEDPKDPNYRYEVVQE